MRRCSLLLALAILITSRAFAQVPEGIANTCKPVTVHVKDASPKDALAKIVEVAGVNIAAWPEQGWDRQGLGRLMPEQKISIDADNQPLWVVLRDFCEKAKSRPASIGGRGAFTLHVGAEFPKGPVHIGQTHLVLLRSIARVNAIDFESARGQRETINASFDIWLDPRMSVGQYNRSVVVTTAIDENDQTLVVPIQKEFDRFEDLFHSRWQISGLQAPLKYDPAKTKRLKQFSGHVRVMVETKKEEIRVADVANAEGIETVAGGVHLVITEVVKQGQSTQIKFTLTPTQELPRDRFQSLSNNTFNRVSFVDEKGKVLSSGAGGSSGGSKVEAQASVRIPEGSKVSLVLSIPMEATELTLPFEFKDLPLP